ncbi:7SK snRNA methylphosphate capping enzyme-like [Chroicocephalus ridibundus]|uniref:7SK snRNA methylphosphate capping enzyme-like n=1 Tax=Chroicocephalus ridibundus TaxID=1192867 RepID=UPI002FDE7A82
MAAARAEAERLREQNRRLRELLGARGAQGSRRSSSQHRPLAQPHGEPRAGTAPRRPRRPGSREPLGGRSPPGPPRPHGGTPTWSRSCSGCGRRRRPGGR